MDRGENEKKTGYIENGSVRILDKKLSKISIKSNEQIKMQYNFEYENIDDNTASTTRLKNISYCTYGIEKLCNSPTKIEWNSYGKDLITTPVRDMVEKIPNIDLSVGKQTIRMSTRKDVTIKELIYINKKDDSLKLYSSRVNPASASINTTLSHPSISGYSSWLLTTADINNDGIEDLIVYGKGEEGKVSSLLFFTSSFDSNGLRKFDFYKELKDIPKPDLYIKNIKAIDLDKDGITDLVLHSGGYNNKSYPDRFDAIKLDVNGNIVLIKTTSFSPSVYDSSTDGFKNTSKFGYFKRDGSYDTLNFAQYSPDLYLCNFNLYNNILNDNKTIAGCESNQKISGYGAGLSNMFGAYRKVITDYNQDGLDDFVLFQVIFLERRDNKVRFQISLVPILATSSLSGNNFELQKEVFLEPFEIETDFQSSVTGGTYYFSEPIFADFNNDGYLDFFMYGGNPDKPYLLTYLQRPGQKYDGFLKDLRGFYKPTSAAEETTFAANGFPTESTLFTNYYVNIVPTLSDINNDGFQEINLQFIARPKIGSDGFIYSLFSQAAKSDVKNLGEAWLSLGSGVQNSPNLVKAIETPDGRKQQFEYQNFSQAPESQEAKPFPIRGSSAPILVTKSVENYLNNVLGSKANYSYSSPRVDVKDNRFLGFETTTETLESYNKNANGSNVTDKLVKETVFNQNYPFIGMAKSIVTKANDALVSKLTVADADFVSDSAYPTTKVKFPRIKKSTVENYELGTLVSKTVTANNYENVFGNLTDSTVTTSSADGTSVFTTTVKPTYGTADKTNWIPGLIKDRVMTASRTGQTAIQTKTSYEYDTKRQVIKKIDEPDDPALKLQTDYSYDAYGNVTKVSVSGTGNGTDTGATRTVSSAYEAGTGYPAGVFKTRETNALSQQSTATYDAVTGQLLTSTDINGVASTQKIDALGRVIQTKSASGVQTDISYQLCKTFVEVGSNSSECEKGENYKITSTSTLNAPVITYKDANGNVRRTLTKAYDNVNNIVVRNEYTASGRLYRSSSPSLSNVAYANLQWTTYEYDALGRITKLTEPGNRVTSYTRSGLQTTMTNAKNLKRTEKSNIANEVVEIVDHDNKSLKYSRDALGRITQTTDASGNSISLTLDKNGNKLQQVDPELGTWKYRYNVLGQPVWQQDGKGQQTTFQYDSLGRLIKRTEPDLTSTWTWDSATNGKGQLAQVSSTNGFSESYSYDSYGRQIQTTTSKKIDPIAQGATDPDFITKWNYDNAGRMLAFAYPTGFGYRNIYDTNGYLKEVRNLAGTQLYWSADARDARGNVTEETLGNGLVTKRAYKADTGFIESISTGDAKIQQNTYSFDALGNLTNRNQNLAGISVNETFSYDNINRLTSVVNQSGGKVTATYDAIGNLTAKSDTGTYNYATGGTSCGVHKVCTISSTTGGLNTAFSYDANGNLLSGNNRSYSWTSFNMPLQIKQGTTTESFMYDANHERVRRTSVENGKTTTTLYINPRIDTGGTFEKSYLPDGTAEYTHYLYAGGDVLGSYVSKDKGTPPTGDLGLTAQAGVAPNSAKAAVSKTGPYRYFHSDHLTSIEVITDATGAVVERLSYDPWGKRRNADGTVASTVLKGTKDSHGFTSHEMLDSIGLVHMNGRVYDPQVGRFTSADPTIDGADNLQGYNRYSYVQNNPGTLLDPSGYSWFSKVTKEIGRAFTTVLDDWLGTCSKSRGDCNVTIGATYGANNQGVGSQNDGRTTVQPFIGFGGSNQYNQINLPAYEVGDIFDSTRGIDPNDRRLIDGYELAWERNHLLEEQGSDSDEDTTLRVIGAVNNELTAFHHTWTYGLYGSEPTSGGYVGQTAGMVAGLFTGSTEVAIARNVGKGAIWSATKAKSGVANAFGHWKKHGKEFPELLNAKQYVEATRKFLTNPPTGTLTKVRPNGEIVRYNEKTNVIGIMTKYGVPKTMFKPDPKLHGYKTNLEYFHAQ
ncbi:RHS repeat-associated core domain-containing protein [Acinetobacter baumannii]